jgi:hypothetical protein
MAPVIAEQSLHIVRRALEQQIHGGSVVPVRNGQRADDDVPGQATQGSASVLLIFVGAAALGLLWLLFNSLRGRDAKGVSTVVAATDTDDGGSIVGSTQGSECGLMGRKGSKKPKSKSKWGRGGSSKARSGGKHQSLRTPLVLERCAPGLRPSPAPCLATPNPHLNRSRPIRLQRRRTSMTTRSRTKVRGARSRPSLERKACPRALECARRGWLLRAHRMACGNVIAATSCTPRT